MADTGGDVTTAEEEAVDCVVGASACRDVVEFDVAGGVGGEGREEVIEVGLVGTVGGESGFV